MIDWQSFLIVFVTALGGSCLVVALFSFGIRFLATPAPPQVRADGTLEPRGNARDEEDDDVEEIGRPLPATIAAYTCFVLSAGCVLVGIYLIVPALHG